MVLGLLASAMTSLVACIG